MYLTVQDGIVKRYNEAKKELGIAQFIKLSILEEKKNGYIVNNTCIFGVEIFVLKPAEKLETVTFLHNPPNNKFTWKILHFSSIKDKKFVQSDQFLIGQRYWTFWVEPKGGENALSAYLVPKTRLPNTIVAGSYATFKMRILNQRNSNHIEYIASYFYAADENTGYGFKTLIYHTDLYEPVDGHSKGFLVKDSMIFEAEVLCVNETQVISN